MENDQIEQALNYFGFGGEKHGATVFVYAAITAATETILRCDVIHSDLKGGLTPCEFPRNLIVVKMTSQDTALIEIPKWYLDQFGLWDCVLDDEQKAKHERHAIEFNAPYLQAATPEKKPERVGGIRI